MRVVVTANQVPFMRGGAEYHSENLIAALRANGHEVELVRFPFKFSPQEYIQGQMDYCERLDFNHFNGYEVDRLISLQFPGFGVQHRHHRAWVMHQHRAVYDLFDDAAAEPALRDFKEAITAYDNRALGGVEKLFADSQNVAGRLARYNNLNAKPLYHPPPNAEQFRCDENWGYILYPSRLERLKRQSLLIEAAVHLKTEAKILIAGDGGQKQQYQALIDRLGVEHRVRLIGSFSESEKKSLYAHALAVFFGPLDEDYGYITLEAMLASKPVITCVDSGGPLEFVESGVTGLICEPTPEQVAEAIDSLYSRPDRAREMGNEGRATYERMGISWSNVVDKLLG